MAPHIFLIGATGYVGGTLLNHLHTTNPSLSITALVRTPEHAKTVSAAYPKITIVLGDLDSHDTLVAEAAKADIVIQCSHGDHEAGILSLADGVTERDKAMQQKGGFKPVLILVSGSANLIQPPVTYGEKIERIYSDVADAETIRTFGPDRMHAELEQKVQKLSEERGIRFVILAPCAIFGKGTGPVKTETFSNLVGEAMVKGGRVVTIGDGESIWSASSVRDVAKGIVFVVEEALKGDSTRLQFGWKGYYFLESFETGARERTQAAGQRLFAEGKIRSPEVVNVTVEESTAVEQIIPMIMGTSSRARADRLRGLGWTPEDLDWKALMAEEGAVRV